MYIYGLPGGSVVKILPAKAGDEGNSLKFGPWVGKIPWRRKWQLTPVFLPGESQGWGELGGLPSMGPHRVGHD